MKSQSTNYYGDKTTSISPLDLIHILSEKNSEDEKAQQEPHLP